MKKGIKLGSNKSKERKRLIKKCDELVSLVVRKRDKRCVVCGSTERLQCGHLIKRGKSYTRFDLVNCNCQCSRCNFRHNQYPESYTSWFVDKWGTNIYRGLIQLSLLPKKWTVEELTELKKNLEQKLEELMTFTDDTKLFHTKEDLLDEYKKGYNKCLEDFKITNEHGEKSL